MATLVQALNSSKLLIRIGDLATVEQFIHPCMINAARGIQFTSSPVETQVPFCPPNEDDASWVEREIDGKSASINGAGVFDAESHVIFRNWFLGVGGSKRNIHVEVAAPLVDGGGYYWGRAVMSQFEITGDGRLSKLTANMVILSDGEWKWTNATS